MKTVKQHEDEYLNIPKRAFKIATYPITIPMYTIIYLTTIITVPISEAIMKIIVGILLVMLGWMSDSDKDKKIIYSLKMVTVIQPSLNFFKKQKWW